MNCERARKMLEQLMAGEAHGREAREVRIHLAACRDCAAMLNPSQWVEVLPLLDQAIEPSEDFARRFRVKLESRPQPWWKSRALQRWPRPLAATGGLAAIVLAGVLFIREPAVKQEPVSLNELSVAESLPLLEDMPVITNLDFLEDFETIENLPRLIKEAAKN